MLMKSSRVTSPLAAGIRRPRVILPESIEQQVSAEQFRQILVHEMAHVARRDPTFALLQNAVACLFWLHPLVHVLNRGLRGPARRSATTMCSPRPTRRATAARY